jgi:hypothetical protein
MMAPLRAVAALSLPDGWIGAGFVRNRVWDALSGFAFDSNPPADIDVVWFDPGRADAATDAALEAGLRQAMPDLDWSVKNQARMHLRNRHRPYTSTADALAHWLETATGVAARLTPDGVELMAPHGLDDLLGLVLRPSPDAAADPARLADLRRRAAEKGWPSRWPRLKLAL